MWTSIVWLNPAYSSHYISPNFDLILSFHLLLDPPRPFPAKILYVFAVKKLITVQILPSSTYFLSLRFKCFSSDTRVHGGS
jgi:hypothetical protein